MPKLIDLTNKQFGRLTVLKRAEQNTSNNRPQWECKCNCGNPDIIIVSGSHLRDGHTQSCGCLQKETARNNNFKDIKEQKFGILIALENIGSNKNGSAMWKCKCSCGNEIVVKGIDLRNGHTQSCGCIKSKGEKKIIELLLSNKIKFETQKTFPTCKFEDTLTFAKFDFYIDNKYLIEYDGIQHFEYSNYGWNNEKNFKIRKNKDDFKNQWCINNNIPLIRIPYTCYENLCLEDLLLETTKYRVV